MAAPRTGKPRRLSFFLCSTAIAALTMSDSLALDSGKARSRPVDMIVVHTIGGPVCADGVVQFDPIKQDAAFWRDYLGKQPVAGIHYVIGRDGTVEPGIPEDQVANHSVRVNSRAVGIELVHRGDGSEPFEAQQLAALEGLIKQIRSRHDIPLQHIVAHSDVDQRICDCGAGSFARRQDPGANFPLAQIRASVASAGETAGGAGFTPRTGNADKRLCAYR